MHVDSRGRNCDVPFKRFHLQALDAVRCAVSLVDETSLSHAIYSSRKGFIVVPLIHATGMELEIIKP
ncbi:MAG: hypothetical protein E6R08_03715 [Nevskiaceae bacterium]|nr:MAG: hypothetical protein E6R08_03715 [Nevskiaceae bacterium]